MNKGIAESMLEKGGVYDNYSSIVCAYNNGTKKIVRFKDNKITLEDNFSRECLISRSDVLYVCGLVDSKIRNDFESEGKDIITNVYIVDSDVQFGSYMNAYKSYLPKPKEKKEEK